MAVLAALSLGLGAGAYWQHAGAAAGFERMASVLVAASAVVLAHREPAWVATGGIALSVFSGNWGHLGVPIPIDRALLALGVAFAVSRYVSARRTGADRARVALAPVHLLLAITALAAVVSSIWAGTLGNPSAHFALLDRYGLVPFAVFVAAPVLFPTERDRRALLAGMVAVGAYLGATAVVEGLGLRAFVWPSYINNPTLGIHHGRARGPFLEAAANGASLTMCAGVALAAFLIWRARPARWTALAVMALCLAGVIFTLTRSAWVAATAATLAALASSARTRRAALPVLAVAAAAVAVTLAVVPNLASQASGRADSQLPIWDRQNLDAAGLRLVENHPLFGVGWGRGQDAAIGEMRQASNRPLTAAGTELHDVYLLLAAEMGVPGLLLWVATFLATVGVAIAGRAPPEMEPWRIALIAIALAWVIVAALTPFSFVFPTLLMWTVAGVVRAGRRSGLLRGLVIRLPAGRAPIAPGSAR